jgi:hypothetical protein
MKFSHDLELSVIRGAPMNEDNGRIATVNYGNPEVIGRVLHVSRFSKRGICAHNNCVSREAMN